MENTGTWNSDEVIFYLFLVLLPISGFFFVAIFTTLITAIAPIIISLLKTNPEQVNNEDYEDVFEVHFEEEPVKNTRPKPKSKTVKPPIVPAVKLQESTESSIVDESISCLCGLGYKKSDARRLVNKLAVTKLYKNSELLIKDVLSSV